LWFRFVIIYIFVDLKVMSILIDNPKF
jgi:hypothetical protein